MTRHLRRDAMCADALEVRLGDADAAVLTAGAHDVETPSLLLQRYDPTRRVGLSSTARRIGAKLRRGVRVDRGERHTAVDEAGRVRRVVIRRRVAHRTADIDVVRVPRGLEKSSPGLSGRRGQHKW
jgi:hypothetical protein